MQVVKKLMGGGKLSEAREKYYRRSVQERLDVEKAFHAIRFYKNFNERKKINPKLKYTDLTQPELDDLYDYEFGKVVSLRQKRLQIQEALDEQMTAIFHYTLRNQSNPYPNPLFRQQASESFLELQHYVGRKMNFRYVQTFYPGLSVGHPAGFSFQIRKSIIDHPESGYGVFLTDGHVVPGTLLFIYPGDVYDAIKVPPDVAADNDYMITRYDNVVVDGRYWHYKSEHLIRKATILTETSVALSGDLPDSLKKFRNPYAVGHFVNHPPKKKKSTANNNNTKSSQLTTDPSVLENSELAAVPNVMAYPFDFPETMPDEYKHFIPNVIKKRHLFTAPTIKSIPSVVLVATKPILNVAEEIYLNYRYNPRNPYPEWYAQPDEEAALRRWGYFGAFDGIIQD